MGKTIRSGLVSLIVPNYNGEEYLKDFIESVRIQSYENWELFIVDDDSNDESKNIVNSFSEIDHRIKLIPRGNLEKGACARRNQGLDMSEGEFICFFDSDDLLPYNTLEIRIQELQANPNLDFVVTPAITFRKTPYDLNKLALGLPIFKNDLAMFLKRYRLPFGVWTNTYRHEFLLKNNIRWDNRLASMQDSDLNIRTLLLSPNYKYSDNQTPGYFWRVGANKNSITQTIKSKRNLESQLYFYSKLNELFKDTEYSKNVRRFGLTLLQRFALLQSDIYPEILINSLGRKIKYSLLKQIYSISFFKKLHPLINLIFSPIAMIDEYIFLIKNRASCKYYIKKYS